MSTYTFLNSVDSEAVEELTYDLQTIAVDRLLLVRAFDRTGSGPTAIAASAGSSGSVDRSSAPACARSDDE
ncbi:MAG: hypothetical protein Q7T86_10965 [Hyphomicrobiaceae bacterium]|nr:hypothetical protein [Hyphomicrobiaceae bacterium]